MNLVLLAEFAATCVWQGILRAELLAKQSGQRILRAELLAEQSGQRILCAELVAEQSGQRILRAELLAEQSGQRILCADYLLYTHFAKTLHNSITAIKALDINNLCIWSVMETFHNTPCCKRAEYLQDNPHYGVMECFCKLHVVSMK